MAHIKALVAMICRILAHILAWADYQLQIIVRFFQMTNDLPYEVERSTPTWRETVWPLCAAILLILAMYFVLTVGGN